MEKVFQHSLHKCIWDFVAKTGKDKKDWPMWERNGGKIPDKYRFYDCFACEYCGYSTVTPSSRCEDCPLEWPDGIQCSTINLEGLYAEFVKYEVECEYGDEEDLEFNLEMKKEGQSR